VPISVRQHAASIHTHIKLTCKTKEEMGIVNLRRLEGFSLNRQFWVGPKPS